MESTRIEPEEQKTMNILDKDASTPEISVTGIYLFAE